MFDGVFLCFTREKCEIVAFSIFKIFVFNFYQELGLNWSLSLWLDGRVVLGWKARRPAETYQDPYIGEKSSNDCDKDISNICMLTT